MMEALELGLLMGVEDTTPSEEERGVLRFPHQHFIDFLAGKYVSKLPKVCIILTTCSMFSVMSVRYSVTHNASDLTIQEPLNSTYLLYRDPPGPSLT